MRKLLIFCFPLYFLFGLISTINSQVIYSPKIDSIINLVSIQQLYKFNKEITGDTAVLIRGVPKRIVTRYEGTQGNQLAAQYLYEKFAAFGLATRFQNAGGFVHNVIGWKTGTKYPNKYFLIGAHFDNKINDGDQDTTYGADDNGTGICVLLELARLMQGFNTEYSIAFVAFNFEETNGKGSKLYSDSARIRGDSLMGVLNAEMLGYDGNGDNKITVISNTNSDMLFNQFLGALTKYNINLVPIKLFLEFGADHISFWNNNYKAITTSEYIADLSPNMHLLSDRWFNLTPAMFEKLTKANIATLLSWATGNYFEIQHSPLLSGFDTTSRIVTAEIVMPYPISAHNYSPKIYYRFNNGLYHSNDAFEVNGIKYKFLIPGQSPGTKISYYLAAQDSAGNISITAPFGGGGVNPPGSAPPQILFEYYILTSNIYTSVTVPKNIPDGGTIEDTIHINRKGKVVEVKVSLNILHQNNADVSVVLKKDKWETNLITASFCNGSNFINTNFTDTAALKIIQGSAPYTGHFRGVDPLSIFKNNELQGDWILSVSDNSPGVSGTLTGWTLTVVYENTVSVQNESGNIPNEYKLYQNYPNPFNSTSKLKFSIPVSSPHGLGGDLVQLIVYDIMGREVQTLVNERLSPGTYVVSFDGSQLTSGVYFYRLTADGFTETKKLLLIK